MGDAEGAPHRAPCITRTRYCHGADYERGGRLRATLRKVTFPAWQDEILAALVVGPSPSRLLWRAGCLSRDRLYRSADEVCAELAARPGARRD